MSDVAHNPPTAAPFGEDPRYALAGSFLGAFAARDYERLAEHLDDDAHLRATLPGVHVERDGPRAIADQFASWFDHAEEFEVVEAGVGQVGSRVHLRWRLRIGSSALGPGRYEVEQHVYADVSDRIEVLDLLCSGFQG